MANINFVGKQGRVVTLEVVESDRTYQKKVVYLFNDVQRLIDKIKPKIEKKKDKFANKIEKMLNKRVKHKTVDDEVTSVEMVEDLIFVGIKGKKVCINNAESDLDINEEIWKQTRG